MTTAQLTPRALDVIADAGETGELPLRNAAPGSGGGGSESLHKFLDAAAAEGLVLDGVDAADLYIAMFPERYAAAIAVATEALA